MLVYQLKINYCFKMFIDIIIFLAISLFIYWFLRKLGLKRQQRYLQLIPGPPKNNRHSLEGKSGTFYDYVRSLHDKYGSEIVGFHLGEQFTVSIASAELFQEHSKVFNRPLALFKPFEEITTASSLHFANGEEAKRRHAVYSRYFSNRAKFYPTIIECVEEMSAKLMLDNCPAISLQKTFFKLSSSIMAKCAFGDVFTEAELEEFFLLYHHWAAEVEDGLRKPNDDNLVSSARKHEKTMATARMKEIVQVACLRRKRINKDDSEYSLIDIIHHDMKFGDEAKFGDTIVILIGGIHSPAFLLTWAIYFLTQHQDVQNRLFEELQVNCNLFNNSSVTPADVEKLIYLRQVVDESLRLGSVGTFAARSSDEPIQLGGYTIPSGTPVLHALPYVLHSGKYYSNPDSFDPEHFSKANVKNRHPFAFKPFGFAGNRMCPGNKFTVQEVLLVLSLLTFQFQFSLSGNQIVETHSGFVTRPKEDIWVNVQKRI